MSVVQQELVAQADCKQQRLKRLNKNTYNKCNKNIQKLNSYRFAPD